jgi:SAM-dependent methyltransferase
VEQEEMKGHLADAMKEDEIRPQALFDRYLELCEIDARAFSEPGERRELPCPACGSDAQQKEFEKWGFGYVSCLACDTLFQSPRAPRQDFARFYRDSPSSRYWAETFFPSVAEARRVRLFRPKVDEIVRLCSEEGFTPQSVADIGAGFGIFLEEWRERFPRARLVAIEPNPKMASICRSRGLEVVECFVEEVTEFRGELDLVVGLEVIEHIYDPLAFCRSLRELLREDGRLLLTGLTVDGFDIQVLWERSKSVSPPHHINFLSVGGFEALLGRGGLRDVRVFTPGKLDVDIVRAAARGNPEIVSGSRFLSRLLRSEEDVLGNFQKFLTDNRLSSHCWGWARR